MRAGDFPAVGWWAGAAALSLLLVFGWVARWHGVNADEGFYILAGKRILAGERLYTDFFYPQMPYLPLAAGALFALLGVALESGRWLSVVPGALAGGLLVGWTLLRTRSRPAAVLVFGLYAAHVLNLNYLTVTKTYGLVNLALLLAFVVAAASSSRRWAATLVGFLCALAVGARLPAVPVAIVLGLWIAREEPAASFRFVAGALLGALPCLWLFAADAQAFWFNNVGFHELRKEIVGWAPILQQKFGVLARWLFLPQNAVLWVLALWGVWRGPRDAALPLACATGLGALYLYATPTYLEYMVQLAPFLLLAAVPALDDVLRRRAILAVLILVYVAGLVVSMRPTAEETKRGEKLALWNLETVQDVARVLREGTPEHERILSWWEGYPWLAEREGYKGVGFWESNVGKKLPPELRRRYHLLDADERIALVEAAEPYFVVFADGTWDELKASLEDRYVLHTTIGAIQIFIRKVIVGGALLGGRCIESAREITCMDESDRMHSPLASPLPASWRGEGEGEGFATGPLTPTLSPPACGERGPLIRASTERHFDSWRAAGFSAWESTSLRSRCPGAPSRPSALGAAEL